MSSRLYADFIEGTITNNPLLIAGTSITSTVFEDLPEVASPETLRLVLDPERVAGEPEIVIVTAHTAASDTVTVTRAADGTSAREHLTSTKVVLSLVTSDITQLQASPQIVKERVQDIIGSTFGADRQYSVPVTIAIPSDWNSYDLEVQTSHKILNSEETNTYFNLTKVELGAKGSGFVFAGNNLEQYLGGISAGAVNANFVISTIGYREGETATGNVLITYTTEIEGADADVEVDNIIIIVTAYRVT